MVVIWNKMCLIPYYIVFFESVCLSHLILKNVIQVSSLALKKYRAYRVAL